MVFILEARRTLLISPVAGRKEIENRPVETTKYIGSVCSPNYQIGILFGSIYPLFFLYWPYVIGYNEVGPSVADTLKSRHPLRDGQSCP